MVYKRAAIIAVIYLLLVVLLMNWSLTRDTIFGSHSLEYKVKIILALSVGMWTSMSRAGLLVLVVTAILTGLNLSLLIDKLDELRGLGKVKIVAGGSSILGIVASGCATCGLPILALLGLGGSVAYLPGRGIEIGYVAIALLLFSLYQLRKSYNQVCRRST